MGDGSGGMRKLIVAVLIVLFFSFLILTSPVNLLLGVVHNLPSSFVAIFLVNARKANFDINTFLLEFQNVGQQQKTVVSISVMAAFLARVFFLDKNENEDVPDLRPFLLQTAAAIVTVGFFEILKLTRSRAGDWSQVVRRSPNSVARGLARAFYSYLANVIVGVEGVSWPHIKALNHFLADELLESDENTWICDKVIVLCPESVGVKDNVEDLLLRAKKKEDESHGLWSVMNQRVEHQYEMAGQMRISVLHLIKLKYGGAGGKRNNYFVFAENRPLVALHQMVIAGLMTQDQLQGQFQLFHSELERLLVEDRECQDRYTVVKYKEEVCISKVLKEMVNLRETK